MRALHQRVTRRAARSGIVVACLCLASAADLHGAILRLQLDEPSGSFQPGENLDVLITMSGLNQAEAAGFQAFLSFDSSELVFLGGSYLPEPFGLGILDPIVANGQEIDLAAGINVILGQPPTTQDAPVATLTFQATVEICLPDITFRNEMPPTQITDMFGNMITPFNTRNITPVADCNSNQIDDGCDITDGTSLDTNGNGIPDECECPGDIDGDGMVGITDFLSVLGLWGPCAVPCPPTCAPDVDGDCIVGINDFLIVLGNWGPC